MKSTGNKARKTPWYVRPPEPVLWNGKPNPLANSMVDAFSGWKPLHEEVGSIKVRKAPGKDLNKNYRLRVMAGYVLALLFAVVLFRMPVRQEQAFDVPLLAQEVVHIEEIRQTKQEMKAPAPPRPPVPVEVPDDRILDEEPLDLDASLDINTALAVIAPPAPPAEEEKVVEEESGADEIFVVVENMPEIVGGMAELYSRLNYPEMARRAGIEGLVVVQVVIEADGTPSSPEVARSPGEILSNAAIDAIMQLHFKPGMQRGKAVRVRYALPVRFQLNA